MSVGEKVSSSVFCLRFLSLSYKESRFVKGDAPRVLGTEGTAAWRQVGARQKVAYRPVAFKFF